MHELEGVGFSSLILSRRLDWCGSQRIVLAADAMTLLDLETGRVLVLFEDFANLLNASLDGRVMVFERRKQFFWCELPSDEPPLPWFGPEEPPRKRELSGHEDA